MRQILGGRATGIDSLPIGDPAIQFGAAGFFETLRVERRGVCLFEGHMTRLGRSLAAWRIEPPPRDLLIETIRQEVADWPSESELRLRITVGSAPGAVAEGGGRMPSRAWVGAEPLPEECRGGLDRRPTLRAALFEDYRMSSTHPLAGHKSRQHWLYQEARRRAAARGFDEAIMLNERGELVEASVANLFWFAGDRLRTPAPETGCLPGTFGARLESLARREGLQVERVCASPDALLTAEGAFLTNSTGEMVGLSAIGDREFAPPRERPLGRRLFELAESDRSARIDLRL